MKSDQKINGIILAGGKATRMGGIDKGLMDLNGKTIIETLIETLKPVTRELIIVSNNHAYDHLGLKVIPDLIPGIGPMGGLLSGLTLSDTDLNFVIACDMPGISTGLLRKLLENAKETKAEACIPETPAGIEPLCAIYHRKLIPQIQECIAEKRYAIRDLLSRSRISYWKTGPEETGTFANLNTENDYKLHLQQKKS